MSTRIGKLIGRSIADRYRILGEIGSGGMGRVLRAMPFDDPSQDVAIKLILRDRQINSEDLLRFQKEAALMSRLHHPNIICFYELGLLDQDGKNEADFGHGYYIVMEIANGTNLKSSLEREGRKSLSFFFQVATKVADALDYTHGKNIIHRDIKPQNIVVGTSLNDPRSLNVKILDFGVARLAEVMHFSSAEQKNGKAFQDIAGTPLYMAPEQTRLLDAPIDHRVDLYSIGCVLYEILTGRPPFTASTREKLEREHVFSNPEPISSLRPDVPPIVEMIVLKLLAKHPDDRYQSAFALNADLLRAKNKLERKERPSAISFPLALNDRFSSVSAKLDLVGREQEIEFLISGYETLLRDKGRSRLSVLMGSAGSGKTRLLTEFRNYLAKRRVRFISANFSQHENALPFNALANGFNDYLLRLLKSQPHEAEELRRKVRTLLGPTAHLVAEVVPGLKAFIPPDILLEPIQEGVEPEKEFSNFAKAFSDFTRCLSTEQQPVVFIFDDLHWADKKSLDLIDQFFSHNNSQRFYLVVSYRTNDPMTSSRFQGFLDKFRKLKRRFEETELKPLDLESVKALANSMLQAENAAKPELVEFLHNSSSGNPLHIVESLRTLVSSDLIRLANRDGEWQYDVEAITNAQLRFSSIDLVLSRVLDFQGYDRSILETASTIGMNFQFELLVGKGNDARRVVTAIERGIDEGLIARVPDEPELLHLGKSYSFTHWRARELIYQNIDPIRRKNIHLMIAQDLRDSTKKTSPKIIFALAHHLNAASEGERAENESLAQFLIEANISAGKEAMRTKAWQSAQRYFENAYMHISHWPNFSGVKDKRALVIENLGDLEALQKRQSQALARYDELARMPLDMQTRAAIAYKRIKLQIASGVLTKSAATLKNHCHELGLRIPRVGLFEIVIFSFDVLRDILSEIIGFSRLRPLLSNASNRFREGSSDHERKYYAGRMYLLGQQLFSQLNPKIALELHQQSLKTALRGESSALSMVQSVADRAILIGYFGFSKIAYRVLDICMEFARATGNRSLYGYLCLMRGMILDYMRDRDDEVKVNMRAALRYLSPDEERVWYGISLEFLLCRELMKAHLKNVSKEAQTIPDFVQTRNWISPRAMAVHFFALLLSDTRDQIVSRGETYLKRRAQVAARNNDLFVYIIATMLSFAKGEIDKTKKFYVAALNHFLKGNLVNFLYPFEEDFVGLFLLTFPEIFLQEQRRPILRDSDMRSTYLKLRRRIDRFRGKERGVANLLRARVAEMTGRRDVKVLYDNALRSAKLTDNHLILIFSYLWVGDYLLRRGAKFRNEYLRRAHESALSFKMNALVEYIEKTMEKRGVAFKRATASVKSGLPGKTFGNYRSRLVFEHIEHVATVLNLDTSVEQHLDESLSILSRYYFSERIFCVIADESQQNIRVVFPFDVENNQADVLEYIQPYLNIRSSLFLPVSDAPWRRTYRSFQTGQNPSNFVITRNQQVGSDRLDQTVAVNQAVTPNNALERSQQIEKTLEDGITYSNDDRSDFPQVQRSLQMSALIPLRFNETTVGVLFVEDIDLSNKDSTHCRNELDVFGAQLAMLIAKKLGMSSLVSTRETFSNQARVDTEYQAGVNFLEESSWLRLWSYGKMRAGRESGWYLGLNIGSENYVLAYCRFNGSQDVREKISAILWHQMHIYRTLAVGSGRGEFDINEIKDEIAAHLNNSLDSSKLDALSFAFTIFNREHATAMSGHFGPSRPLVLCQENNVTPDNRVVATLENGRDIRFWAVSAGLRGPHVYILTHDSSRLEVNPGETQRRSLLTNLVDTRGEIELHELLERLVMRDNVPRYYVGAVFVEGEEQDDKKHAS